MEMQIEVMDSYPTRGRRGCNFHYINEDNLLYHIRRYAKSIEESDRYTRYKVPMDRVKGKLLYLLGRTNSGHHSFFRMRAEDFLLENRYEHAVIPNEDELKGLKLGDHSPEFNSYLEENWKHIECMVQSFKQSEIVRKSKFTLTHPGVDCFMKYGLGHGYWFCAMWPEDERRKGCLSEEMKYIHQCWVFALVADSLGVNEVLSDVYIEMGRGWPSVVFKDSKNRIWSGWVEPQIVKEASAGCEGPKTLDRFTWKRADVMFVGGDWRGKEEMIGLWYSLKCLEPSDLLIECKHEDFHEWWKDGKVMDEQLRPYSELFKPKHAILISLKEIPDWAKRMIEGVGWEVLDKISPCSDEEVARFKRRIREILSHV